MISDEDESKFTSSYIKFGEKGQAIICAFAFPSTWVEVKKKDGLTAANYQTGDGLIFSAGAPGTARTIGDVGALAIVAEATPSDGVAKVRSILFDEGSTYTRRTEAAKVRRIQNPILLREEQRNRHNQRAVPATGSKSTRQSSSHYYSQLFCS